MLRLSLPIPPFFRFSLSDLLYFGCYTNEPVNSATHEYFSIDNTLLYAPFYLDFGPLNLGAIGLDFVRCYLFSPTVLFL